MHPIKKLYNHAAKHQGDIRQGVVFSTLNKIFDLAPPLLIGLSVDIVVKKDGGLLAEWTGVTSVMGQLAIVAVLTLLIWALESVFEYLLGVKWRTLAQNMQHDLRLETYAHVQKLELAYFEDRSTGNLVSIMNDDINQLERFLDTGANDLIQVATTVVVIGGIFFYLSPMVAALSFLPIPLILWGSFMYQRKIEPRYANVRSEVGILNGILSGNLSGIATVKSYNAEQYEIGRIHEQSLNYARANESAIKLSSSFSPLIRMAVLMGFLATLLLGGHFTTTGALEVGSFSVMVFMTQRLLWPLTRLGATFDQYQRAMASINRIFSLLHTPIQINDGPLAVEDHSFEKSLAFKNVDFRYQTGPQVLKNINLEVPKGKTVAIVGATGSGKSTLIKLLLRFYDPTAGAIEVDGRPLTKMRMHELRSLISYVGQDTYLFHGSVKENIAYGSFNASEAQIIEAAKASEAHDFIMGLEQGYDTIVGERGQKLSGGQRQRLSLARAILKDAPIFLFDEATSAVDNETEAAIQRSLLRLMKTKTSFAIAHRLSTIVGADVIYVMDKGQIVEAGTHHQLLERQGLYAKLWSVQSGRNMEEHVLS